ncbi:hypothetical protein GW17_00043629 [Ensete ventricosum]|nr:hypothetical protein GW17_00043629 [Ensete ventricosum]
MFTWLLQEVRELQELQRTLYTFLHVMANHDLSSVLIAPNCMGYLDAMMQLLLLTACSHKDILLRKVSERLVLFGEIVLAQKVMYEKLGNDFIIHFVSEGLQAAHCPNELAEQYYQKLQLSNVLQQANDTKALRSFYQLLIENLRQQQNGSLVFR